MPVGLITQQLKGGSLVMWMVYRMITKIVGLKLQHKVPQVHLLYD
jgi:hypothetical protein